jgi:hypothetical protein
MVFLSKLANALSVADRSMIGMVTKLMTCKPTRTTDRRDIKNEYGFYQYFHNPRNKSKSIANIVADELKL